MKAALTKLNGPPANCRRVLLVDSELRAAHLRRQLFPDTAVIFAAPERLGNALYRDEKVKLCGDGLMIYVPLDLYAKYRGDSQAGLGVLARRLVTIPLNVTDLDMDPVGLKIILAAADSRAKTDDAEYERELMEAHDVEKRVELQPLVKGVTGSHPATESSIQTETGCEPQKEIDVTGLQQQAAKVLASADPIKLVEAAIKRLGYGGDIRTVIIVYLAATSRLLAMRRGSMPVHLLLIGQPSAGKSYAVQLVLSLLPEEAAHIIDAGSPRALIYTGAELKHKVVNFGEAESLPAGEDNPAASAVRNLAQDNRLHYQVVEKGQGGKYVVREIEKEGPSVLITTAVKRLGEQLTSRFFVLDVPDDQKQIRSALNSQASLELHGSKKPSEELIAFQALLQHGAPFDVVVPFVAKLAEAIGRRPAAARINRDFARLLSLIKSVAILRHSLRQRNDKGQIIAELADYETIHELIADMFEGSVTGAGKAVIETVEAVTNILKDGNESATVTQVAKVLDVSKRAASGRVRKALSGGWLVNGEDRRGHSYRLAIGDPLPDDAGLPTPAEVGTCEPPVNQVLPTKGTDLQGCEPVNPRTGSSTLTLEEELEGMRI